MSPPSSRLRITLPYQEVIYLNWLAVESGNDVPTEAALLLKVGIRLAISRYRDLYNREVLDPADQATLDRETPGEPGYQTGGTHVRPRGHPPVGGFEVDPGEPPLVLPDWAGGHLSNPHRERGFAGHGEKDKE